MDVPGHRHPPVLRAAHFGQASNHTQDLPAKLPVKAKAWGLNRLLGIGGQKIL